MLGDPVRLRTRHGSGYLCGSRAKLRFESLEQACAMVERLLEVPENVESLRAVYGDLTRADLESRLADQLFGGWSALMRTKPKIRPFDEPETTDIIIDGNDDQRPPAPEQKHALRVRLPAAPEHEVELTCAGTTTATTTDATGRVEFEVPEHARTARLRVLERDEEFKLDFVPLSEAATRAGAATRLRNLGFVVEGSQGRRGDPFARALRLFQVSHSLAVTGEIDSATSAALRDAYGS